MTKPKLFIGSSMEGLEVARTLEELLEKDAKTTLWTSDVFQLSDTAIESLYLQLDESDFAVFVLTPDDLQITRSEKMMSARDNVIFEAGLFFGRLGRHRTFLVRHESVKIPSDLSGLNFAVYGDRYYENPKAGLGPAANKIRRGVSKVRNFKEIDFIKSYINFIQPDTLLADDYRNILSRNYEKLKAEVSKLESRADWEALLEVKIRMREFFEYSGKYKDGIEIGRRYVKALNELGQPLEAIWASVKHVGYLQILDGKHREGRQELLEAIHSLEELPSTNEMAIFECLFYCNRYIGISYHRDEVTGDLDKAESYFNKAEDYVNKLEPHSRKQAELRGRILGNYGNLELSRRNYEKALTNFRESLKTYEHVEDEEHIGIANLQIAQTIVSTGSNLIEAEQHLEKAESIFIHIGWLEGQGRVFEQYARLFYHLALGKPKTKERDENAQKSMDSAKRSQRIFDNIGHQKGLGRIEALIENIRLLMVSES